MNKVLNILAVLLVTMIVIGLTAVLAGCGQGSASGGMGGQGWAFKDIDTGGGAFNVTITNTDGGTLANPSVAVDRQPTTQPATQPSN